YTPDANVNNGIWTDFQTTSSGDLFIHPSANNANRFVGINTTTPQTTLEVNGTITTKQLIIANENQKQDVTAMLNELKNEIAQLKEQLNQITKN
ncbi:MAG TPA: hypothetical protein PKY09_09005, partial [Bacteroidia bacterium]|nr:hypothetical protein [Bacteroidia bacterium]